MENMIISKAAATFISPYAVEMISYMDGNRNDNKTKSTELNALTVLQGTLIPAFSPDITEYSLELDQCISQIILMPSGKNEDAMISVNNSLLMKGQATSIISLEPDMSIITIEVSNINSDKKSIYTISPIQIPNLHLTQLELNYRGKGYMMNSAFSLCHSEAAYNRCVSQEATHFSITPYAEDNEAVITIAGQILKNKEKSAEIEISEISTEVVITVSHAEADKKRDYILSIIKNFT